MREYNNLNIVKDTYVAYRDRDLPGLLNCLADDVRWFAIGPPDLIPTSGTRHGRDQVEQYFSILEDVEDVEILRPHEFIVDGDKVVAIGNMQRLVRSTGSVIDSPWVHVFTLQNGKIIEFRSFYDTAGAVVALEHTRPQPANRLRSESLRPSIY